MTVTTKFPKCFHLKNKKKIHLLQNVFFQTMHKKFFHTTYTLGDEQVRQTTLYMYFIYNYINNVIIYNML